MVRTIRLDSLQPFQAINVLLDAGHDPGKLQVPNGVQFQLVWQLSDGKIARNILGMQVPGTYTPTAVLAEAGRAAIVSGGIWTALAAFLAAGTSLLRVELRDIRNVDQPLIASTGAATPGTSVSAALPSEVAAVLTLRTALTGPGNRGRMYVPGFATNALATGDVIAPAAVTALTNWATNLTAAIQAAGGQWALTLPHRLAYTSPATGVQHPERAAHMQLLTGVVMRDNHWDTQRRRGLR